MIAKLILILLIAGLVLWAIYAVRTNKRKDIQLSNEPPSLANVGKPGLFVTLLMSLSFGTCSD